MKQATLTALFCIVAATVSLVQSAPIEKTRKKDVLRKCHDNAKFTQYWVPKEGDKDHDKHGNPVKLDGPKTKELKDGNGKVIAKVAKQTYDTFQMEGTGLLLDGRMVNLGHHKNVFMELDRKKTPFGVGSDGNGLAPWVSIAANDIPLGTKLYVKELDGLKLPDGIVHNGCVRVDDEGWSFDGCHLDFFVFQFSAYLELHEEIPERVTVMEKDDCVIQDYVTESVKKWAELE